MKALKVVGALLALSFGLIPGAASAFESMTGEWWGPAVYRGGIPLGGCAEPLLRLEVDNPHEEHFKLKAFHIVCDGEVVGATFFGNLEAFYNPIYRYSTLHEMRYISGWMGQGAVSLVRGGPDEALHMDLKLDLRGDKLRLIHTLGWQTHLNIMLTADLERKAAPFLPVSVDAKFTAAPGPGFRYGRCDSFVSSAGRLASCY